MKTIEVHTQKELAKAKDESYDEIIVVGSLADKLKKASKISQLSKWGIGVLTAALGVAVVAAPVTRGLSFRALNAAAPVAKITGVEIATIITASTLGIALVLAIYKGYEEISYENGKMILRKKQA